MFLNGNMHVNEEGHLHIAGLDTVELIKKYGSPLYIFDEDLIRTNCRNINNIIINHQAPSHAAYAGKAFLTLAMCRLMEQEGMYLDAVSGGELYTAYQAGFPAEKIIFHGNNKTHHEIEFALKYGVGRLVIDNFHELKTINHLAGKIKRKPEVLLRITPGVSAHTHEYIRTGHDDSKFGFTLSNGQALEAVSRTLTMNNLLLKGLHCHIGSQIFSSEPFLVTTWIMLNFASQILEKTGWMIEELDMGGGFGIRYTEEDHLQTPESIMKEILDEAVEFCKNSAITIPTFIFEPGRSIVGAAGTTLYSVGTKKTVPSGKNYLAVDGGMSDNPRYALYQALYTSAMANRMNDPAEESYCIAGKCCESGDIIIESAQLPVAQEGDILAVFCTGAYNYSMSSNYNRIARPAALLASQGKAEIIVKRESPEDIIRNDLIPLHLTGRNNLPLAL